VLPERKKVKPPIKLPIESLTLEPYASILCYPHARLLELESRIQELRQLGVEAVEFVGEGSASNVPVLGKGYVGIVVVAYVGGERFALKMRRIDADRVDMTNEAEMLKKANAIGVGQKFVAVSNNFLLSQLIDGSLLEGWLEKHKEKALVHKVLVDILEQCWRLDEAGLDHGELSKAPRHLLVDKADVPFIVDFETASIQRKIANVTSVCQYLFAGNSQIPKLLTETLGDRDRFKIIATLKHFKKNRSRENFEGLLQVCLS
jgi:putative serine/threonine protein kinase